MRYHNDDETVSVELDGDRVVAVSIKNSWRDHLTTAELGLALSDLLARAWAEPILTRFDEVIKQSERDTTEPAPVPPAFRVREPSLGHLAAIGEEVARINARVRAKWADPTYFDDVPVASGQEFTDQSGNVTLAHLGDRVVGIELEPTYFDRASIAAVVQTIERAFEEFYAADHSQAAPPDHDPELTADRAALRRIRDELERI